MEALAGTVSERGSVRKSVRAHVLIRLPELIPNFSFPPWNPLSTSPFNFDLWLSNTTSESDSESENTLSWASEKETLLISR